MNKGDVMGMKCEDKITGFVGMATGFVSYLTGCNQVLIQPQVKEDGTMTTAHWFDESRIRVHTKIPKVQFDMGEKPGACDAAPVK